MRTFLIGPLYLPAGQYGLYRFTGIQEGEFGALLQRHRRALEEVLVPDSSGVVRLSELTSEVPFCRFDSVNLDAFEQDHLREVFGYCPPQNPSPLKPLFDGDVVYCVRVAVTKQRAGMWEDIWEYGRLERLYETC